MWVAVGPATVHDFARWFGVDTKSARELMSPYFGDLVPVSAEGHVGWLTRRGAEEASTTEPTLASRKRSRTIRIASSGAGSAGESGSHAVGSTKVTLRPLGGPCTSSPWLAAGFRTALHPERGALRMAMTWRAAEATWAWTPPRAAVVSTGSGDGS